jgi:hypothetical protein
VKTLTVSVLLLLMADPAISQQHHSAAKGEARLMSGLGRVNHRVSTRNAQAQRFFNQGLALIYAFNHEEAERSFRRAAELDSQLAMAHWGVALAVGPNYNLDVDPAREKQAYEAIQKAKSLSTGASEAERGYIEALAKRYSNDPNRDLKKLAVDYKNAMGALVKRYPEDLDAATLYAESMMNLRPWQLWSPDGTPAEGTEEIVAILESVMKRNPSHTGANHYYIHAVEASKQPDRGLISARRLRTLAPAAGHLVHMPAHIYMRVGDYDGAAMANEAGAAADRAYISRTGSKGIYPMMYYNHNLHFLAVAYGIGGRFKAAKRAADQLQANCAPHAKEMAMLDPMIPTPLLTLVQFRRWDDILKVPAPDLPLPVTNSIWHFARGMALSALGKAKEAEAARDSFDTARKSVPAEAPWGLNRASAVLKIAEGVLNAKMAAARGDKKQAISLLRQAAAAEDGLAYDEPPGWYLPVRESLGGLLLADGNPAEAERVFRDDLERHPRSGRSLFGLHESLKSQGKGTQARSVLREFRSAWRNADTRLRVEDL